MEITKKITFMAIESKEYPMGLRFIKLKLTLVCFTSLPFLTSFNPCFTQLVRLMYKLLVITNFISELYSIFALVIGP